MATALAARGRAAREGSMISATAGDVDAAKRAQKLAALLIDRHH
jgi:hypothetical protein